jgi:hypothetical protein
MTCHVCGANFYVDDRDGCAYHLSEAYNVDHEADADHVPYCLEEEEQGNAKQPKTVRIEITVKVHSESALARNAGQTGAPEDDEVLEDVLAGYDDRLAGLVAETLINPSAVPLDIGIEIQDIKASTVQD